MNHDRRFFLKASGFAFLGLGFSPLFLRRALAATPGKRKKVLVVLFQRGAVDGLSMVPPLGERAYFDQRPNTAIPAKGEGAALRLDDMFGLHPALAKLKPFWDGGSLAVVHAAGSPDPSRSHFDAQDFLESGTPGNKTTDDGWLNRAIQAERAAPPSPFRAVGLQPGLPRSLRGTAPAIAMGSISDFAVRSGGDRGTTADGFAAMYAAAVDQSLRSTGDETFDSMKMLRQANPARFTARHGATYPASPLGKRMQEISQLIQSDIGLEVAATDCGGWDTHTGQGASQGQLSNRLRDLGDSLAAFATDLGDDLADVCVVTMTEFGRTVRENGTRGTDHGHGSVMLVLGGNVRGGRVVARWKGLAPSELFEGRDLAVTTDHRDVLLDVLRSHLGIADASKVFPGFSAGPRTEIFRG